MSWFRKTCTSSLGKKYIMAVTGLMLGGFLIVHAVGNATIFWGRNVFLSYAEHLHSLGPLVTIAEIGLLAVFLVHAVTGISLFLQNLKARADRYAISTAAGGRTWGSRTMPYTGLAISAFLFLHLSNVRFIPAGLPIADVVGHLLARPVFSLLYTAGMITVALHISHGFWSLFQSMGINHPRYDLSIRIGGFCVAGFIIGVFILILSLLLLVRGYLSAI